MKVESAILIVLIICIFASFYFAFLSLQATDFDDKKHLVTVAASSLVTGGVILACWIAHSTIKRGLKRK